MLPRRYCRVWGSFRSKKRPESLFGLPSRSNAGRKGSTAHKDDWFYRHPDEISTLVLVHLDFRGTLPRKVQPPQARRGPGWPKRRPLWSCFRGVRERSWSGRANFTVGRSTTGAQFPRPGIPHRDSQCCERRHYWPWYRSDRRKFSSCLGTCRPHT